MKTHPNNRLNLIHRAMLTVLVGGLLSGCAALTNQKTLDTPGNTEESAARQNAQSALGDASTGLQYTKGAHPNRNYITNTKNRRQAAKRENDRDLDGVLNRSDRCPDTAAHVTVDRYGCGLFDAILEEVVFKSGSRWLTPRARKQLDLLADTLLAFPESRIQVRAHTDSLGPADRNLELSSLRAEVVVQYLQSRGVYELQLQAVGMGETQPLESNSTPKGRRRNRRVEIVTLPDQDAGQLLESVSVNSPRVVTVNDTSAGAQDRQLAIDAWKSSQPFKSTSPKPVAPTSNEPGLLAATPAATDSTARRDLPVAALRELSSGFPITGVVTGLHFEKGQASLSLTAKTALKKLVRALQDHPKVSIAIMAHTDDRGNSDANMRLSRERAKAVTQHLVDQGIARNRLKAEGYGDMLPLFQNTTDADHARNRRIEIRITP